MNVSISQLLGSLGREELLPVFQPLVDLHSGRVTGFEVLARWQHPELGLILPANFIGLAEEHGLICRVTDQIMRKALSAAVKLHEIPALSVNVSPCQMKGETLPAMIARLAAETGYPLPRLTLEMTETAMLEDRDGALCILREIKEMGCRLSLDDFGTGYSSLHHLQLPFDELKIDRSFVSSMSVERESRKIVAAVAGLGRSLGLSVVAEGIETSEHAEMLTSLGCDTGQGWLYGKPLPAESMSEKMNALYFTASGQQEARGSRVTECSLEARPEQRLALLQAIYDGSPSYLCVLDRDLRYVSLNRRMAELNTRTVEAHLGRTVKELLPLLYPKMEKQLHRALRGEAVYDVELFRRGTERGQRDKTLMGSYQPMFDEAGEVTGVLIALVDITGRKRAESALRRSVAQSRFHSLFPVRAASRGSVPAT